VTRSPTPAPLRVSSPDLSTDMRIDLDDLGSRPQVQLRVPGV